MKGGHPLHFWKSERFSTIIKFCKHGLFFSSCAIIFIFLLFLTIYGGAKVLGPPPIDVPQSSVYYASDGSVIGELNSGERRYWVSLEDISPHLIEATIAIEDQHFYRHLGFDFKRIIAALYADLKAMAKVQGASTISQQYARNLFLGHEKTWQRKLKEAMYTVRLEANYSKKEILEGYLNTIYYGHGAYGVEAASQYYFNKRAKDLNLSEAAMLAAIPKGPSLYSPIFSYEKAKQRQELILITMAKQGRISYKEAETAINQPLELVGEVTTELTSQAPYFRDAVQQELQNLLNLDEHDMALGGFHVYTTLDPEMQKIAEDVFEKTIDESSDIQGAFIAMDPETGHVKALIGGRNYQESSFNRALQAVRQPGSTIKPILYYAALEHGFTPATTFISEETTFVFDQGRERYKPNNYNSNYAEGKITMAKALALSDNVYAVKTHLYLGEETLVEYGKKFGITSPLEAVPSLALGTSGVRPIEMVTAYSMLANGGMKVEPVFITKVVGRDGTVLYEHQPEKEPVLNQDLTFILSQMMTGIFDSQLNSYNNVTGQSIAHKATRTYAAKSGTTDMDSWMIGYTPDLVAGVWIGYDKEKAVTLPMERQYSKQIWIDFMEGALKGKDETPFKPTKGVVGVAIDPDSGLLATENCDVKRVAYFVKGTEPKDYCIVHLKEKEEPETKQPPKKEEKKEKKPWYRKFLDLFS